MGNCGCLFVIFMFLISSLYTDWFRSLQGSVLQKKDGVKMSAQRGWKYSFCPNLGAGRCFVHVCLNSFQRDVNLLQNCIYYPGVFLLPADVLPWWHLEDILGFGQVTMSKADRRQWTLLWGALAEVSLLVIKALWCWAITSKHRGKVWTLEIMAELVTCDGFVRLSSKPGCKAVYNQEVYLQGKSHVAACIFV